MLIFHELRRLLKATIVYVPVLAFAWIIGLFAMGEEGMVFAYLFVISNVFQVREEGRRVWRRKCNCHQLEWKMTIKTCFAIDSAAYSLQLMHSSYFYFMLQDTRMCGGKWRQNSQRCKYEWLCKITISIHVFCCTMYWYRMIWRMMWLEVMNGVPLALLHCIHMAEMRTST